MFKVYKLHAEKNDVILLNEQINETFIESGVQNGICNVFTPHTTAGLTITSFWDPKGLEDLQDAMDRLIPTVVNFKHQHDTPTDAAGHIKSAIMGVSLNIPIVNGELQLGHSQGCYFVEFDGPRNREFFVNIIGE